MRFIPRMSGVVALLASVGLMLATATPALAQTGTVQGQVLDATSTRLRCENDQLK